MGYFAHNYMKKFPQNNLQKFSTSIKCRLHSPRLVIIVVAVLASVVGASKQTPLDGFLQEEPREPPRSHRNFRGGFKRLPRGSLEVLWELLEVQKAPQATILDTFIVSRASKIPPGGPQVMIYRPCRRFRASKRGTRELGFRLSWT